MPNLRRLASGVAFAALAIVAAQAQTTQPQTNPPATSPPATVAPSTPPVTQAPSMPNQPAQTAAPASSMPTDQQIADAVNARLAVLKAELRLTPAQQPHWGTLETALREAAITRTKMRLQQADAMRREREAYRDSMRQWREDQRRTDGPRTERPPMPNRMSEIELMRQQADMLAARAGEMRSIADAAGPLHDALDDDQRRMLVNSFRRLSDLSMGGNRQDRRRDDRRWERERWRE